MTWRRGEGESGLARPAGECGRRWGARCWSLSCVVGAVHAVLLVRAVRTRAAASSLRAAAAGDRAEGPLSRRTALEIVRVLPKQLHYLHKLVQLPNELLEVSDAGSPAWSARGRRAGSVSSLLLLCSRSYTSRTARHAMSRPSAEQLKHAQDRTIARLNQVKTHFDSQPGSGRFSQKVAIVTGTGSQKGIGCVPFSPSLAPAGAADPKRPCPAAEPPPAFSLARVRQPHLLLALAPKPAR